MSNSKRTHISAYQMYSQHSKSSRHSRSSSSDGSHNNHERKSVDLKGIKRSDSTSSQDLHMRREKSYDSDDEVLKRHASKSSPSKDHSSEKHRSLKYSEQKEDVRKKQAENDRKHSTRSLMDIDFSNTSKSSLSRWKEHTSHHDFSSEEESHGHVDRYNDWKGTRRYSKYSDSEDEGDMWHNTSKSRRAWKNSSPLTQPSDYDSQPAALVVDMVDRLHNKERKEVVRRQINVIKSSEQTYLVIPSGLPALYLHGRGKITVLMGSVNILGCELRSKSSYDVYSPTSGSLLAVQVAGDTKFKAAEVKAELSKLGVMENDKTFECIGNNTIAVIMVDRLESALCDYITSFIPYTQLFIATPAWDIEPSELKGVTLPKLGLKLTPQKEMVPACMNLSQDLETVLTKWTNLLSGTKRGPIVLCTGAKNTGKSTVNRMLINTAFKSVSSIAYLDCDVGQTEFSPPATLSLHVLTQPVLEPPFCHQRHAEKMVFYGETTPNYDPDLYVQCLKFIVEAYRELRPQLPLIVNTMGFLEGAGLMLLIDTLHLVKPDLVVQIESFNPSANLPPVTPEFVASEEGWMFTKTAVKDPQLKVEEAHPHEVVLLPTLISQMRDFSFTFKLKPVDLRNLTLLAALSMNLERGMTLNSLPPYAVPYRQFGVSICHHKLTGEEVLTAIDASVVALCVADLSKAERVSEDLPLIFHEMPICACLGLGIVRGIDTERGLLYLVSSLPRVRLQMMNTILKGSLSLPDQILLKQTSSEPIPYVDALAPSTAVASVRPRTRMPRISFGAKK
ncbi:unnamed protein product [Candidula unifasciata]|uniref:Polynucleotide 5'-hydroxyl-kinase NOL9 n=1 Tax=Candidula unifasciata TaxID=100452 RepID=A0A8S3ZC60_9EUPU|nr:unnamed protein product [Candidula unifasciata]